LAAGLAIAAWIRDNKPGKDHGRLPGLMMWPPGSVPFLVMLDTDISPNGLNEALAWAVNFWRLGAHTSLFAAPGEVPEGGKTVPIMSSDKWPDWPTTECCSKRFGYTNLIQRQGELWSAAVYIDVAMAHTMNERDLRRGLAHELGHVLGLAHDEIEESIMFRSVPVDADPIVTESDKTMLQAMYA